MAIEYVTLGKDTSGRVARACPHWGATWPWLVRWWAARYPQEAALEIIQALGDGAASGGTHGAPGTCLDFRSWRFGPLVLLDLLRVLRASGADGSWYRTKDQGFDPHVHSALDCPCQSPADYQITAVRQGRNGLGPGGMRGEDDGPAISGRNWADGLTWLMGEVKRLEDDMATPEDVAQAIFGSTFGSRGKFGEIVQRLDSKAASAEDVAQAIFGSTFGAQGTFGQLVQRLDRTAVEQAGQIAGLIDALKQVGGGSVDLASVEAAAKRGAQEALRGATVSVDLGGAQ